MTYYYYLSFADGDLPKGTQFLGGLLLEQAPADTPIPPTFRGIDDGLSQIITRSHQMHLNPGGEVQVVGPMELDPDKAAPYLDRLLSRAEVEAMPDLT